MTTSDRYRRFASVEARGYSPVYDEWCTGIANDHAVLALIDELPAVKRQPNLLLAAARFCGAETAHYPAFRAFLLRNWDHIRQTMRDRSTQTNEAGRCSVLLPLLARIAAETSRPLALIEVGASAGLCLYPDAYGYQFDDAPLLGPGLVGAPVLECATTGNLPLPTALPDVVSRAGVDLNPLNVNDDDDVAWLEALVWPEHEKRLVRLRAAVNSVRGDPPRIVRGNLIEEVERLVRQAPKDAVVVVFHSAVLAYVDAEGRNAFRLTMERLIQDPIRPCHWIANEGFGTLPELENPLEKDPQEVPGLFVLKHNGETVARTGPHGQSLDWLT
ncbi:DUF2332 domain-containing protein [Arthrobacter roseus]|uniref:DUF2332 domain-containing protein n=1 Tax=Arthrobacter roseus TaxID=136274 RepID=UPI00196431B3|nr:DUF2332 domain-containing protein [Arthrobacter roseus]MBM7849559.1 hypothetical protein [Arthrobacter roseus]